PDSLRYREFFHREECSQGLPPLPGISSGSVCKAPGRQCTCPRATQPTSNRRSCPSRNLGFGTSSTTLECPEETCHGPHGCPGPTCRNTALQRHPNRLRAEPCATSHQDAAGA